MRILIIGIMAGVVLAGIPAIATSGPSPFDFLCHDWLIHAEGESMTGRTGGTHAGIRIGYALGVGQALGRGPKIRRSMTAAEVIAAIDSRCLREPNKGRDTRVIDVARWALGW